MSAIKDLLFDLESAKEASEDAIFTATIQLHTLSDLIWEKMNPEGIPEIAQPNELFGIDDEWLDLLKNELKQSLKFLNEIEAAKESIEFNRKQEYELNGFQSCIKGLMSLSIIK